MSTSSGTVNSGGNADSYGEPLGRSEEPEVGLRQFGFEVGQPQDAQELPPIPTVEAAPESKALADVTSAFNEKRPSPKKGTTFASKDDVLVRTTAPLAFFASAP